MTDPVEFVVTALGNVPADPREATVADLRVLAAIAVGLTRHVDDVLAKTAAIRHSISVAGDPTGELHGDLAWAIARRERHRQAYRRLSTYLNRALDARGLDDPAEVPGIPTTEE